jgi:hypothetical protein
MGRVYAGFQAQRAIVRLLGHPFPLRLRSGPRARIFQSSRRLALAESARLIWAWAYKLPLGGTIHEAA